MIGIYITQTYMMNLEEGDGEGPSAGMFTQMLMNSKKDKAADSKKTKGKRTVKDENGTYYKYTTFKDKSDNEVFTAVYPEDLSDVEIKIDCARNSQKLPAVLSFVATNDDNTTQLTFTSPQHYQYIIGEGFDPNELQGNVGGCISFYNFSSVEQYLNEIIKQAYPTAKKIEAMDEASEGSSSPALDEIVKKYEEGAEGELAGLFGLPSDTSFSHVSTYKSDRVLSYRIVTKEDHAVSCRFYVPVFSVIYDFANDAEGISGQLSDTYMLSVSSFEAGSDELYDWYEDAFSLFVNNFKLTDTFMNGVAAYAKEISGSIEQAKLPPMLDEEAFGKLEKDSAGPSDFLKSVDAYLSSPKDGTKTFVNGDYKIITSDSLAQIYFDPARELLFATGEADEYPGDEFLEFEQ